MRTRAKQLKHSGTPEQTETLISQVTENISLVERTTSVTPNPDLTEDKVAEEPVRNQEEEEEESEEEESETINTQPFDSNDDIIENEESRDAEDNIKQIILERSSTVKSLLKHEEESSNISNDMETIDEEREYDNDEEKEDNDENDEGDKEVSLDEIEREKRRARFDFIIQQAELCNNFKDRRHFLKNSHHPKTHKGRSKRLGEEEEDAAIIQDTFEEENATNSSIIRHYEQSPPFINGTLKPYQITALNWLISRHDAGLSGILADEMGLGKTLESISILAYLSQVRGIKKPYLVIAPKSTLFNWTAELGRWAPFFRVCRFHGDKETRKQLINDIIIPGNFDVIVTSYEVVCIEKSVLAKYRWKYIVIDEAHRIKNEHSRLACVVRKFYSEHRLLLTGTPLQNNLHELWALLNFLVPEVFSSSDDFDEWFKLEGNDAERQRETVEKLHRVLRPFLLRRLKTEVAKALPPKKEVKLFVGMTAMQTEWYRRALMKDFDVVAGTDSGSGSNNSKTHKMQLLNIIMQLRKVCNHPYLFEGAEQGHQDGSTGEDIVTNAGKMIVLDKLLGRLQAQGSRVLIFSQMTRMLDILEDYLYMREYTYARIDGSTSGEDRDAQIEAFNRAGSDVFIFLLSTRAGGLGINLATADTVILYDSDWNPQVDLQAQDRAHRIGQQKPVNVYRFVTEGSVEMKIVQRAEKKLQLDALVIQQGRLTDQQRGKAGGASGDELLSMIRFGADAIFKSKNGTFEDSDLDLILKRGEEQTAALASTLKAQAMSLLSFSGESGNGDPSMGGEDDYLSWDGVNWRQERAKFSAARLLMDLPKRERPQTFSESALTAINTNAQARGQQPPQRKLPRPPKQHILHDFQFFPKRLVDLLEKERAAYGRRREDAEHGKDPDPAGYGELTQDEEAEKELLLTQGCTTWSRREYFGFVRGCEKYGRTNYAKIAMEIGGSKTPEEVETYSKVFWERWREIRDGERAVKAIEKGEEKMKRSNRLMCSLEKKVAACTDPRTQLRIHSKTGRQESTFTEEEDGMILFAVHSVGEMGKWEEVLAMLRSYPPFKFDWFIRSRSPGDIARRADVLLRMVEREQNSLPAEGEDTKDKHPHQAKKSTKAAPVPPDQPMLFQKKVAPKRKPSDKTKSDTNEPKPKKQKTKNESN